MRIKNKGLHALLLDKGCLLLLCVIAIAYLLWSVNSSHGFRYMVFYVALITRLPMSLKGRIITAIITMLTIAGGILLLLKTDHPEYIDLLLTIPVIALLLFLMFFFCKELFLYPIDLICGLKQAECYFSRQSNSAYGFIFLRKWSCNAIRFYKGQEELLELKYCTLGSECVSNPPSKTKLMVTYYRFSRLMIDWEVV